MTTSDELTAALERYAAASRTLAGLHHERAKLTNASLADHDAAYQQATVGEGLAYNPAAARAKSATLRWTMEINKLQGEMDSLLVELRYLDQYIGVMLHGQPN